MLNVREMLEGSPSRLRYVPRYSTSRVGHSESVAEHMYFVAFYALQIGTWVNHEIKDGRLAIPESWGPIRKDVCIATLLQRAVLHDLEEARSGDFPRPFKHSTPEMKALLEQAGEIAFNQIVRPLWGLPPEIPGDEEYSGPADEFLISWLDAKDGTPEGMILEFCDFLAVLGFMLEEGAAGGNALVRRHIPDMNEYFAKFEGDEYNFLGQIRRTAKDLLWEIMHARS